MSILNVAFRGGLVGAAMAVGGAVGGPIGALACGSLAKVALNNYSDGDSGDGSGHHSDHHSGGFADSGVDHSGQGSPFDFFNS